MLVLLLPKSIGHFRHAENAVLSHDGTSSNTLRFHPNLRVFTLHQDPPLLEESAEAKPHFCIICIISEGSESHLLAGESRVAAHSNNYPHGKHSQ